MKTEWCESCEGPMSDSGLFPVADASEMEQREHYRRGQYIIVPRINRDRGDIHVCSDCHRVFESDD